MGAVHAAVMCGRHMTAALLSKDIERFRRSASERVDHALKVMRAAGLLGRGGVTGPLRGRSCAASAFHGPSQMNLAQLSCETQRMLRRKPP